MLPVVICGAGPVGLVLALELAAWQLPVLLAERHPTPSPFPRGRAISTRSMEILRQLGVEQELTAIALPRAETAQFFFGASLTAAEFARLGPGLAGRGSELSPTAALGCPQDRLETLLRRRVADHPLIDARFGTGLLDARQRPGHVEVRLSGSTVRTRWLVGADGSRSRVRQLAGIGADTFGASCRCVNILFDADLWPLVRDRSSLVYTISNTELHATVLTVDNRRRWLVNVLLPDGEPADPTPQWCARMVRAAVGRDDLDFRVLSRQCWVAGGWLARRYRQGRMLLAGDAAHVCTPYGGFGMNLGLADAHNLAWKLALSVDQPGIDQPGIDQPAGADLVDSYAQERRPIGAATVVESARRLAAARDDHRTGRTRAGEVTGRSSDGLVLGGCYRSAAVHATGGPPPHTVESYRPDAAPGCRAPHVRLPGGRSTLDLFGPWFTLLTGPRYTPRDDHRDALPGRVRHHRLDDGGEAPYRLGDRGAVLVRPDGHVAWRSTRDDEQPPATPAGGSRLAAGRAGPLNR